MIASRPVVAIIPARGGSKGIPRKNLARLGGVTLLERAIAVAREVPAVDRIVVSTDDAEIARVARAAGAEIHERPPRLATDASKVIEAIRHLCDTLLDPSGAGNALLVLLEPTCPLRTALDVARCVETLAAGGDAVATFTAAATNPWRAWRITDGRPEHFVAGANPWLPRQQLPPAYELTGAAYAFWRDNLRDPRNEVLCGDVRAVILPPERSLDIDTVRDLHVAEALLKESNR
ncbi:MAG TPA: acylneuraminate cytidylyltransferase family protein [Candidatus Krumholzibacteria bacterium]|nr:acylneuraminate cytidylyltransferase family protein [Candidatus Krumholzibacteria bacterium]HPD70989.1 acylneuraminate cytidylyltransferase family protein [Candidatus Krumholzibacteria bacterium]HRY39311.1 acylneuraminate cytidylyltransferase family protein [Candidatus Krumholzibacteria bacterium]